MPRNTALNFEVSGFLPRLSNRVEHDNFRKLRDKRNISLFLWLTRFFPSLFEKGNFERKKKKSEKQMAIDQK